MKAHEHPNPRNRPEDYRSFGAITLGPVENEQGGYYFMSLENGKMIHRFKWTVLPFNQAVVDKVEELAEHNEEEFTFTDGNWNVIEDEEENNDYESYEEDNNEYESEEEDDNEHKILDAVGKSNSDKNDSA